MYHNYLIGKVWMLCVDASLWVMIIPHLVKFIKHILSFWAILSRMEEYLCIYGYSFIEETKNWHHLPMVMVSSGHYLVMNVHTVSSSNQGPYSWHLLGAWDIHPKRPFPLTPVVYIYNKILLKALLVFLRLIGWMDSTLSLFWYIINLNSSYMWHSK